MTPTTPVTHTVQKSPAEIVEDLEAALEEFRALAESLEGVGVDIGEEVEAGDVE